MFRGRRPGYQFSDLGWVQVERDLYITVPSAVCRWDCHPDVTFTYEAVVVNIQSLDARSLRDNAVHVAAALQHALETGRAPGLAATLRNLP